MKKKLKQTSGGVEVDVSSLSATGGRARVRLRGGFDAGGIHVDPELVKRLNDPKLVSQFSWENKNDNFNFQRVDEVMPKDGDYISVNFRALSKVIVPGHWIDWTKDNVLQDATPLFKGATVYANHDFFDINGWLGSVANAAWDETGAVAGGTPGVNCQYKIDALMNPRIARGLLMSPPAIHSTSMTVLFEFEYSHPEMAAENKWKFIDNLGENIDGEIVRFIVTKIVEIWEASLVFQGADRLAKQYDAETGEEVPDDTEDFADMAARLSAGEKAAEIPPPSLNEEKTMKLTDAQKTQLGIKVDGDEVPETEILKAAETLATKVTELTQSTEATAVAELTKRAEAGDKLVDAKRTEVTRLAKLAELKADDDKAELDEVVTQQIAGADADGLIKLEKYFEKKVAEKFPKGGRSSLEDPAAAGAESDDVAEMTAGDDPAAGIL